MIPSRRHCQIQVSAAESGAVTVTGAASSVEPNAILVITNPRTGETVTVTTNPDGSFFAQIAAQSGDILELQLRDAAGNQSAIQPFPVSGPGSLPPDPATVATPLSETAITPLAESTAFLYGGPAPIQTGVAAGTIDPIRAAVIRGRVLDKGNQPLAGVTVTIKDHPEYGQTLSRTDGAFDLALNGGGLLTVNYEKTGYLPVQRQVQTPWHDYVAAEDIVLVALDPLVTTVDLTAATPIQVALGSPMTDADGSRQATVFFPQGTAATLTLPDGSTQSLTNLHVRATEYTVGSNGPLAMPGPLPATSGYTYAVELSVDEAITAGATRVDFSQPLPVYVDNFLNFPVGEVVPVGWYDRAKAAWIPADNGKVIKILSIDTDGLAALDTDGSGLVAGSAKLATLGITAAEQAQLASLYPAGKTLWRVQVTHFTPWDCNWPWGPPPDSAPPPPSPNPGQIPPDKDSDECDGCVINPQARSLGEELPITGSPYKLHYQSRRVPGHWSGRAIDIRLSGDSVPASLKSIDLEVTVAGRAFVRSFPPTTNQSYRFLWDGRDGYGRPVPGNAAATVTIGYSYNLVYYAARSDVRRSFAQASATPGVSLLGRRQSSTFSLTRTWQQMLDGYSAAVPSTGSWSLSPHHVYDSEHGVLELGTGERHAAAGVGRVIATVAGDGSDDYSYNGSYLPATQVSLRLPEGVALSPNGSLYIADTENSRIRRVKPNGILTTVAGTVGTGYNGNLRVATQANLNRPESVVVGADGSFYIADTGNSLVRRVGLDGLITNVAGVRYLSQLGTYTGSGYSGDNGPAASAQLSQPRDVALGANGSLYIADTGNTRIRRVGPDGVITTVAGNGSFGYGGDGGPAKNASFKSPSGIAIGPDGSLYIADTGNRRIRRVGPDGVVVTVAGTGTSGYSGDGGLAVAARLSFPSRVIVSQDGTLYIADGHRIRRVGPDGIITTLAGTGSAGYGGDTGPVAAAALASPSGIALGPDKRVYIADTRNHRIRQIAPPVPGFGLDDVSVSSSDGLQTYLFDNRGRHLATLSALTGAEIYRFTYDAAGRLSGITDGDNNFTRIERADDGLPTAIIAPDGQRTNLTLDAQGYLASVENPAGEAHSMTYTPDGLLATFTDPKEQANDLTYDALGRLVQDTNAGGGGWTITAAERPSGFTNTLKSGEGRARQFGVDYLPTGDRAQTNTHADGTVQTTLFKPDRYQKTITAADGTVTTSAEGPDPRFGMQSPVTKTRTLRLPSGLSASIATSRTATQSDPNDLLSLVTQTETTTLNGRAYTHVFDRAALTRAASSPLGRSITTTVDPQGRPVQRAIPGLAPVALAYDIRGRLVSVVQSDGTEARSASLSYYASGPSQGYLESLSDALGRTRSFEYDPAGRVTAETLPGGRTIAYGYDANGNLTLIAPPGQPPHLFDYTALDQAQEYNPPPVATFDPATRYTYNRDKQLTRISRPDGQIIDFAYDAGGRASAVVTPTRSLNFGYHSTSGNLISLATSLGVTHSYTYDGFLLTGETLAGPVSGSLGRSYNSDFDLTGLNVNGSNVTFAYDNDRLLTQAGALTLSRDPQNGFITGTTLGSLGTTQSYNAFGELAAFGASYAGTGLLSTAYTHDRLGRIVQKTETLAGVTTLDQYAYDAAGRLSEVKRNGVTTATYAYDANGNRTAVNGTIATHDAQDRLLTQGANHYTYADNGELRTQTAGSLTTTYTYDVLGNLTQATLPNGTALDYVIDGRNRRIGKKINGTLTQSFLYQDQLRIAAELDGGNRVVSRFVYGTQANVPEYLIKGTDTYRIITDHLGSVRLVVNTANGGIIQRMDYDSFGNVTADTNAGFQPFGFAGGLYDRDTKLIRFGARDYDAETGRWTAKDPIGFGGGDANVFAYVGGNPVSYTDPLGLVYGLGGGPYSQAVTVARSTENLGIRYPSMGDAISQPNGKMWGETKPQDWMCTLGPIFGPIGDICFPDTCKKHDQCYEDNGCNSSSWISSVLGGTKSCNQCNSGFFE